jgi:AraC-like DNA-binding protein
MFIVFDAQRPSDSPYIERIWRCHSERAGTFLSVASSHWELVVTRLRGDTTITLRGPETRVSEVACPADGEWFAVRFKAGTFMPKLPVARLIDGNDVTLPRTAHRSFALNGSRWEIPTYDNAETFVARLARASVIERDAAVVGALQGEPLALSTRTAQRHFLHATGMTHDRLRQIERARHAASLLRDGVAINDAVHEAGYFDQAHLTRSLKSLIGLTPSKIVREERQLSFLYKTTRLDRPYDHPASAEKETTWRTRLKPAGCTGWDGP